MRIHKPICVDCKINFNIEYSGCIVVDMYNNNKLIYKLWYADIWVCPKCKKEIVVGFGKNPFLNNFDSSEEKLRELISKAERDGTRIVYCNERY